MAGNYERCGATTAKNSQGHFYLCNKKAGHKDKEHADTKRLPVYRWKDKD